MTKNGERVKEFCSINDMKIGNTFWKQLKKDQYAFVAEKRDPKSIINYIVYT